MQSSTPASRSSPVCPLPSSLAATVGISFDFSSSGYLDVSVPRVALLYLWIQHSMYGYYSIRVFPFGYLRVSACLQLVVAFRSLPRPSSALSAKASTVCPYSLDLFVFCIPTADLHMQYCECIAYALSFLRFFSCKKLFFLLGRKLFYLTSISEKLSVIHCVVFKEPLKQLSSFQKKLPQN